MELMHRAGVEPDLIGTPSTSAILLPLPLRRYFLLFYANSGCILYSCYHCLSHHHNAFIRLTVSLGDLLTARSLQRCTGRSPPGQQLAVGRGAAAGDAREAPAALRRAL
jgi:hypothetical protein